MAKTYIPLLSYKNKTLNILSHAGAYIAFIGLIVLGFANAFGEAIPANTVETCTYIGLIAFLGGLACIALIWIIAKIRARKAK